MIARTYQFANPLSTRRCAGQLRSSSARNIAGSDDQICRGRGRRAAAAAQRGRARSPRPSDRCASRRCAAPRPCRRCTSGRSPRGPARRITETRPSLRGGQRLGFVASAVRRVVVHDEHLQPVDRHQRRRRAVAGCRARCRWESAREAASPTTAYNRDRPSKRSEEICSEIKPTRNTITANRIRITAPFGIRPHIAKFSRP